ncbi:hypothetical protein NT6N_22840 [Oceaniferula spumae]|uniref:Cupin type-2 domain-containing protein n=1 Tax=Oceaniferula spumae TaxID=2979115 RepID=A0AAT9FMQ9_9BACT
MSDDPFSNDGFSVVPGLLDAQEVQEARHVLGSMPKVTPCIWDKELAASSANFHHLATHPRILELLRPLLGENIILWGACYLERVPGQVHPWHTDIESSRPEGGFVTVWIGLEGTNQASSLKLVPGTHKLGRTLQECMQIHDKNRETTTDADVESWAGELAQDSSKIVQPDVTDGDAIVFDGRLWHGSSNDNKTEVRRSLIFQYAVADAPVFVPDFSHLEWPFKLFTHPRPPCIAVSGEADNHANVLAEAPPQLGQGKDRLESAVHRIDPDLAIEEGKIIRQRHLLLGATPNMPHLSSHFSVLAPGQRPHPPHTHVEEEILIVLRGKAELSCADETGAMTPHEVTAGDFVYYPAFHRHTISNPGTEPVVYLMFKWLAFRETVHSALPHQLGRVDRLEDESLGEQGFQTRECFGEASHHLKKFHAHISTLLPDGGYAEHCDEHDIAIIVTEGEIKTLDTTIRAGEMVWITAGDPHGMENPGDQPARYLVLEFHGENCSGDYAKFEQREARKRKKLLKGRSPKRVLRNIRRLFGVKS